MGGSSWSDDSYATRAATRAATSTPTFVHTAAVHAGTAASALHPNMNPFGVKFRESRDSDAHPQSNPIAVILDQTGSMERVIHGIQKSLCSLMGLLIRKNYLSDPQVLFAAIGDFPNHEAAPLQVGQFESGLEMEDDMSRIYIEGNGGGQKHESYQNAAYFMARHTVTDAWEKRGRKGYIFIVGDEMNHVFRKGEIKQLIGDDLSEDLNNEQLYKELAQRWNVFFILPKHASYGGDPQIINHWKGLVGPENVLEIEDESATAELIATQIGLCEGTTDVDGAVADMKDLGISSDKAIVVANAVSKFYSGSAIAKVQSGALAPTSGTSGAKRI